MQEEKSQLEEKKLQDMEENNEGLRVMFDEALERNTQLEKEFKKWKIKHREMFYEVYDTEEKYIEM